MSTITKIAKNARAKLGRPIRRSTQRVDWEAVDAIKAAASECGLTGPLFRWVVPSSSLTKLAQAFVLRYAQAYGMPAEVDQMPAEVDQVPDRAGGQETPAHPCR